MLFGRRKSAVALFMLCLTCALFVFASEHSHAVVFGEYFQDVCRSNDCVGSSSTSGDVTLASKNILPIHVVITFANADYKRELQAKFELTVTSLFQHSTRLVMLYVIGDAVSQRLAKSILAERVLEPDKYKVRILMFLLMLVNVVSTAGCNQEHCSF